MEYAAPGLERHEAHTVLWYNYEEQLGEASALVWRTRHLAWLKMVIHKNCMFSHHGENSTAALDHVQSAHWSLYLEPCSAWVANSRL